MNFSCPPKIHLATFKNLLPNAPLREIVFTIYDAGFCPKTGYCFNFRHNKLKRT